MNCNNILDSGSWKYLQKLNTGKTWNRMDWLHDDESNEKIIKRTCNCEISYDEENIVVDKNEKTIICGQYSVMKK